MRQITRLARTPLENWHRNIQQLAYNFKNVDGVMHFIYSHKYNTISAEDSSDMN